MSLRLDLRTSQTLVMTPQLRQAIQLLQMSHQELGAFVESEVEQNPLLERPEETGAAAEPYVAKIGAPEQGSAGAAEGSGGQGVSESAPSEALPEERSPLAADDAFSNSQEDFAGEGFAEAFDEPSYGASHETPREAPRDGLASAAEIVADKPGLRDHLLSQIHVDFADPTQRLIASSLVELLDEGGYLPADLDLARTQMGASPALFEEVIQKLQRLDPPGIFARSLKECLAIQLREKNRLDPAMQIVLDHLDLVAKRENAALMRLAKVDAEDLTEMLAEIRALAPKPAWTFSADVAPPIVPDVFLIPLPGGGWQVELNSDTLPRVLVNERYYESIQSGARVRADKDYLAERWQKANWLIKALSQRATTVLKVAGEIVRQQDAFFLYGVQYLKPIVLRDIAAAIEMHESTISRVTQNKYIATPRGLFELKYFFTTALATTGGNETVSARAVQDRLKALVDAESPQDILSDEALAELLRREGIAVARRTVAKYRESLKIPPSSLRRRRRAVAGD